MSAYTDNNNNNNNNNNKSPENATNPNTNSTYNSNQFSPVQSFDLPSTAATTPRAPHHHHQQQPKKLLSGIQLSTITHGFVPRVGTSRPNSNSVLNIDNVSKNVPSGSSHTNTFMKSELQDDSSSLSDLSMMEDAIKWYDANNDPNITGSNTMDKSSESGSRSRSTSMFKEMEDLGASSKRPVTYLDKDRGSSINRILEIYTEASPSKEKSLRDSLYSSKENSLYFHPSSSSSLINYPKKLDTKLHTKNPKDHSKDLTNDSNQTSEDSGNISLSNIYKNDSTVSTLELLNSLINDQPMSSPPIAKRSSSRYTTRYKDDFRESLTNVLENDRSNQEYKEFRRPLAPLNPVHRARSPPQSVVSSSSGGLHSYNIPSQQQQHRINIYNFQQQWQQQGETKQQGQQQRSLNYTLSEQPSEDHFIPVQPAIQNSFPLDLPNIGNETPTETKFYDKEKSQFTGSTDSFQLDPMLPHNREEDEGFCPKNTSRLLILFSLLIPPFYLLIALGVLDHKIGKIDRRHRLIAGIFSIFGILLILLAVGLGFGYGLTHI